MGWAYCITSSIDIVTVSWRWLGRPLKLELDIFLNSVELMGTDGSSPTSRGSYLLGDSPIVLLLSDTALSDNSLEWNDETDELVSSVTDDKNRDLSDDVDAGDGPCALRVLSCLSIPLTMMVLFVTATDDTDDTGVTELTEADIPDSSDLWIPCKFFKCLVLSPKIVYVNNVYQFHHFQLPLYLNLFPQTWHWNGLSPVCLL